MKKFAKFITKMVLTIFFKVEVYNRHKVPTDGPALLCANHNTILDMFFLGYKLDRWIYWMAKEELFKSKISGFIFKNLGAFPVKRGTGDVSSVKSAYKLLNDNKIVGIFPHGTRIDPSKIDTAKVKSGAAMIAANTGVPIIPATVIGNYKLFSRMRVVFGDPFVIEAQDKKLTKEDLSEMSRDIIKRVYKLSEGNR